MDLGDVQWGDVLFDTGEVVVCQGIVDDDAVLVKRWAGAVLDAELAARRALQDAGVATAVLLGHGEGWLCLEDLSQTMWRPASAPDLASPGTLRALGRWLARVHALPGEGLPPDPRREVLDPTLTAMAAAALPAPAASSLPVMVPRWLDVLDAVPGSLLVGCFQPGDVRVIGDGIEAMVDDLSLAHRGAPVADLGLLAHQVGRPGLGEVRQGYVAVDGARWPVDAEFEAAEGVQLASRAVVAALTGDQMDPPSRQRLATLCTG